MMMLSMWILGHGYVFNDYFVDIGRNIAELIGGNHVNHLDYMTHINQPNFFSLQTNSLLFH